MADPRDDAIRKRYRELATEEPSAALDDAIRAAARRAVSSGPGVVRRKPGAARWAVPASVAAVLFLSFGVVMRMEKEAPPISEPMPSAATASKDVAPAAPSAPAVQSIAPAEVAKEPEAARDKKRVEQPRLAPPPVLLKEKKDAAVVETKPQVMADAIAPAKPAPPPAAEPPAAAFAPSPAPAAAPAPKLATVPATANAPPERAAARAAEEQRSNYAAGRRDEGATATGALGAAQPRAKSEALAAKVAESVDAPWPDTPEKQLERIEALRKAGRDKDADEGIARFRREHPDYRIPDATWERIRAK